MTNAKRFIAGISTTVLLAGLLTGCGGNTAQSGSAGNSKQLLKMTLLAEPQALDTSVANAAVSFDILNAINEGLYRLGANGEPIPALAASMPVITNEGKTYTIKLRDNIKWSDDSPVTAKDFEYAWKRTLDPKTKADYAFMVAWIKGGDAFMNGKGSADQVQVKAIDDKTLTFTLENPIPFMTAQLSFPVFFAEKQEFVEKYGDKYAADADKLLFDGPFQLSKWDHEQSLTLVKNDKYWDKDNVKLNEVDVQIASDNNTLANLYQSNAIDVARITRDQVDQWKAKPDYQISPQLYITYVEMNEAVPALKNDKIRQALALSIDRSNLVDIVFHDGSQAPTGFVPNGTMDGNNKEFRKDAGDVLPKYDPAQAKTLLAQGLKEAGLTSFPTLKFTGDDTEDGKKALEFIQGQWKQNLGIDVTVESIPHKLRIEHGQTHQFDLLLFNWGADYNDPMTFLDCHESTSSFNESQFKDPEYDQLIEKAKAEPDGAKRAQYLVDAEKILVAKMPVAPVNFRAYSYLVKPNAKNILFFPYGSEWDLKNASVE
ncbi:peptide ABC transporter substrate-binding protein [Desulfosporosinus sp. OT]|uniref:peptide ABC transporter substrate-binding protein n=1 Tax=Desulfosporosinus sp. OT TaxID=913865 RepID=UPI0002239E8A|nr:peptide ABC transporter substrate-binding protein [Desulfosporosinus sp. OT]EGW38111.1 bacterial extracellular solute-binding s, 5 Middle family protein [Desulfosporosinus sp. OT]